VHPSQQTLAGYVGEYQAGPLMVKITERSGKLYAIGNGQPMPSGLIAVSNTEFYCNDTPAEIRFVADAGAPASGLVVKLFGREIPVSRVVAQKGGN
jgi:hypothetical protein